VTVAEYYAVAAVDGRAPLGEQRTTWISRARSHGRVTYWLCRRDDVGIEVIDPTEDIERLRIAPYRQRLTVMPSPQEAARRLWSHANPLTRHAIMEA